MERQSRDGCDENRGGGEEDVAFVGRRIEACPNGEIDERAEKEHVGEWNDVKHFRIAACDVVRAEQIVRAGEDPENDHCASEKKAGHPELTVNVGATRGYERSLRDEEENPAGERGSVDMNDETGERRAENSGQVVRAKPKKTVSSIRMDMPEKKKCS